MGPGTLLGFSLFLHFALLFWNQTWTLDSLRPILMANSSRAKTSGYGARSNAFSNSSNWKAVKVVLEEGEERRKGEMKRLTIPCGGRGSCGGKEQRKKNIENV